MIPYFVRANGRPLNEVDYKPNPKEDGSIDIVDPKQLAREAEAAHHKSSANKTQTPIRR